MAKNIDSKKDLRKWVESLETDIDLLADLVDYLINAYYDSDAEMGERFDDFRSSVLRQWAESQEDPAWDLLESAFGVRSERSDNWIVSVDVTTEVIIPVSGATSEREACAKAEEKLLQPEDWSVDQMSSNGIRINGSVRRAESRFALPQ